MKPYQTLNNLKDASIIQKSFTDVIDKKNIRIIYKNYDLPKFDLKNDLIRDQKISSFVRFTDNFITPEFKCNTIKDSEDLGKLDNFIYL